MASKARVQFLEELTSRFGPPQKLSRSNSMFDLADGTARVYVRYSRLHDRGQAFYGLRKIDLQKLAGHSAVICFLWDDQELPLCIPFYEYEELFAGLEPAADGQHKVQVYTSTSLTELYVANAGRFNVESHMGWAAIQSATAQAGEKIPDLSHSQIQTLLGAIGSTKGYGVWVPPERSPPAGLVARQRV